MVVIIADGVEEEEGSGVNISTITAICPIRSFSLLLKYFGL
jgi:hypothetical protein